MSKVHSLIVNSKEIELDAEEFTARPVVFGTLSCKWIYPSKDAGTPWTKDNLIFRSLIVADDGRIVSAGFKKFFNKEERPEIDPLTKDFNSIKFIEKLDGSLLITSKIEGQVVTRTRRSFTDLLSNGYELDLLKEKYPLLLNNNFLDSEHYSLLYEWVSPNNRIILNYPECDVRLLSVVDHRDYSYLQLDRVKKIGEMLGIQTPRVFDFSSWQAVADLVANPTFKEEGFCAYYNNDQNIRKVKGNWYLDVHYKRMCVKVYDILTIFYENGFPAKEEFINLLADKYDFECMDLVEKIGSSLRTTLDAIEARLSKLAELGVEHRTKPRQEQYEIAKGLLVGFPYLGLGVRAFKGETISNTAKLKLLHYERERF